MVQIVNIYSIYIISDIRTVFLIDDKNNYHYIIQRHLLLLCSTNCL